MTRDEIIEVMARGIYKAKGCAMPWEEALEWLEPEPYSTPALDVKRCRLHATAAYDALVAAGLAVVRSSDVFAIGSLSEPSGTRTLGESSDNLMQVNSYYRAMKRATDDRTG